MIKAIYQTIKDTYGTRATDSPLDRELYSRDLAPVPALLVKPLFQTLPELIVRPATASEVADLMHTAYTENIPVTPRASATTVFFNTVPVRGGMVMDLSLLTGIVELNQKEMTVTVRAATTWADLEHYLNQRDLACKSMPSSAPSATVGGWLNMMGYGIGSIKYGRMLDQVRAVEVVLPDGRKTRASKESDPPVEWYGASEGTLGIVTEIVLEVRPLQKMKHFLIQVPNAPQISVVINKILSGSITPYNMHFSDSHHLQALDSFDLSHPVHGSSCRIAVDFEGSENMLNTAEQNLRDLAASDNSVEMLPETIADAEWQERFKSLRLKRGGPSMLGGEIWLPIAGLPGYLAIIEQLATNYGVKFMSYGHVVSQQHATVMTMFFSDETRRFEYLLDLSLVKKIQDAGYRQGGSPYGIGLWNTPYLKRIHNTTSLKTIRERKRLQDPHNILNPGKVYQPPIVLQPFVFNLGMDAAAIVRRIFKKRR